jgi:hypothetical protein
MPCLPARPGSVLHGNGIDKTFIRQPAICLKYLLDEQDKQFNWERLGQLGQNTAYAALFYVGVSQNVYIRHFIIDLLAQAAAKTLQRNGDIEATIEGLDFFNAGVKETFGSKFIVFQEVLKTYGRIEDGQFQSTVADINQEFAVELFYRLIFSSLNSPIKESEKFAWDVLKRMTRSEAEDVTNKVMDDIESYLKEKQDE